MEGIGKSNVSSGTQRWRLARGLMGAVVALVMVEATNSKAAAAAAVAEVTFRYFYHLAKTQSGSTLGIKTKTLSTC